MRHFASPAYFANSETQLGKIMDSALDLDLDSKLTKK